MQYSVAVLLSFALRAAADVYTLSTTIPWMPTTPASVDQSAIYNNTYYLSHRNNGGVQVIDLASYKQITIVKGFHLGYVNGILSVSTSGPDGMYGRYSKDLKMKQPKPL
ncbi:hypothetical protein B0J14DRAFT_569986 [Halenospora varia]|nr:hypothetical protein B0J14DRAFT_569986 [Halenospora varia]